MEPISDLAPNAQAAFDAAYDALMPYTRHAQVRADIAEKAVRTLLNLRQVTGMGHMAMLVGDGVRRWPLIDGVQSQLGYASKLRGSIDVAIVAAARVLAEG